MSPIIVPTILDDIEDVAEYMREDDVRECLAGSGLGPRDALHMSVANSERVWTISWHGTPIAIYGLSRVDSAVGPIGVPWLLGTPELENHPIWIIRESKKRLESLMGSYDVLLNMVDKRNTSHIDWIKWCGFEIVKELPMYGFGGLPFLMFMKIKDSLPEYRKVEIRECVKPHLLLA